MTQEEIFIKNSEKKAFDSEHEKIIRYNISQYYKAFEEGKKYYANLELAKKRAANIRYKAIENLEKLLVEFEKNFTRNGGKLIYAIDTKMAIAEILNIVAKHKAKSVVKSKSMVTEELDLNTVLHKNGVYSYETDLGEFIVQINNEKPYHIITPAMHKSAADIAELFNKKFQIPPDSTPEQITAFVREYLRNKFIEADIGITGANFLIADTGSVALTENEGNGLMSISFPKVHIVICGIEKIIPSLTDLSIMWPILALHGTGQKLTTYNTIISGPRKSKETDGPLEMYVILLDNNRTKILEIPYQRKALACIRCGACLNFCPVYKFIGGHTYGSVYSGPIGAVITPLMKGEEYKHLSYASSLCGKCSEVCPVKIPIHKMLIFNRKYFVDRELVSPKERKIIKLYKFLMSSRFWLEFGGTNINFKIKKYVIKNYFHKQWGERRELPEIKPKTFNKLWKERKHF